MSLFSSFSSLNVDLRLTNWPTSNMSNKKRRQEILQVGVSFLSHFYELACTNCMRIKHTGLTGYCTVVDHSVQDCRNSLNGENRFDHELISIHPALRGVGNHISLLLFLCFISLHWERKLLTESKEEKDSFNLTCGLSLGLIMVIRQLLVSKLFAVHPANLLFFPQAYF